MRGIERQLRHSSHCKLLATKPAWLLPAAKPARFMLTLLLIQGRKVPRLVLHSFVCLVICYANISPHCWSNLMVCALHMLFIIAV